MEKTKMSLINFQERSSLIYYPMDAQLNIPRRMLKFYIKINIKSAPTCFGLKQPSSGSVALPNCFLKKYFN